MRVRALIFLVSLAASRGSLERTRLGLKVDTLQTRPTRDSDATEAQSDAPIILLVARRNSAVEGKRDRARLQFFMEIVGASRK